MMLAMCLRASFSLLFNGGVYQIKIRDYPCVIRNQNEMGFQDFVGVMHTRDGYEKLVYCDKKLSRPRRCSSWVKKMNGRLKGLRLSRSKKLTFKAFSLMVLPRKIARVYGDVISRIKIDDLYPNIIFSTQLGLPVLSHPSLKCRRNAIYFQRNLISCSNRRM